MDISISNYKNNGSYIEMIDKMEYIYACIKMFNVYIMYILITYLQLFHMG